ncbi:PR domain zinc finger protein 10 [Nymphon striatum]|nr:PR domain zinc finger protein 10 [Nymphon striatum]
MEPSSSESISRASSTELSDEDSPVVASSSENKLSSVDEMPESSFRDPDTVAYEYEIACPTQSSQYQGLHSDLSNMPGSSTISVSVVNSSQVPESTLMMDQYSMPSQNSLSPESTTMLSPAMNIQVQPSSTSDGNQITVSDIQFRTSSRSPVEVSASTSASIQDISQHNKVISTSDSSNVLNIVESSSVSDIKEEIQSSDIQPSCNAEISWQHSSASNMNPEPSTSSHNDQASHSLVAYRIAEQHETAHFGNTAYTDAQQYQLNTTANDGLVYSTSINFPSHQQHFAHVQHYNDITSLAESYHNAPTSSGVDMFADLQNGPEVESSTEVRAMEVVSSNNIETAGNSEAEPMDCSDRHLKDSTSHQLDSTTDQRCTVSMNSVTVDSTADISESLPEVHIGSTARILNPSTVAVSQQISMPFTNSVSETRVISMDDYPSTSNSQFVVGNIPPGFCEVDEQKVLRNFMQQQALMSAMLHPGRNFEDTALIDVSESEKRQMVASSIAVPGNMTQMALPTFVSSSTSSESSERVKIETLSNSTSVLIDSNLVNLKNELNAVVPTDSVEAIEISTESSNSGRSQRPVRKRSSEITSTESTLNKYWCEDCQLHYQDHCPQHHVQTICDLPVQTRARASLPTAYLSITKIIKNEQSTPEFGVFAKKSIPRRTKFGPVEGVVTSDDLVVKPRRLQLFFSNENNQTMKLDTSDETKSNWMRFVRISTDYKDMNLVVIEQDHSVYFLTTKMISAKSELKVHYSSTYAQKWKLEYFSEIEVFKLITGFVALSYTKTSTRHAIIYRLEGGKCIDRLRTWRAVVDERQYFSYTMQ